MFYFGAVNGGVWKTTNGGQTWRNVTDGKSDISSVGAIAVAPSDPNVIYVGTGESQLREDLTYGTGVYRSTDGGGTLAAPRARPTRSRSATSSIDPRDPDRVYVAAIGHAFGPNAERGVFRTTDGGRVVEEGAVPRTTPPARWTSPSIRRIRASCSRRCGSSSARPGA